jgi:uncharacterized RDD family membrane protein YckC
MEGGAPAPERPPGYAGPAPPSGWQQPIARPASGWAGKPLASWGSRVAATLIDGLVLLIPAALVGFVIFGGLGADDSFWRWAATSALYLLLTSALVFLYAPLMMMRRGAANGQTLGKQALGIRVVRDSGEPVGFWFAVVREVVVKSLVVWIASTIIPFIPWFLDNFWPLWDDENRALHDMVVSTHVVRS